MVLDALVYGLLLGISLSFMVGPVFLVLVETSIKRGVIPAIVFNSGVLLADIFLITVVLISTKWLEAILSNPMAYTIGGVAIAGFGLFSLVKAKLSKSSAILTTKNNLAFPVLSFSKLMAKGFLINFLNVGVLTYWLTMALVVRGNLENNNTLILLFFATSLLTYFITDIFKIVFAAKLRQFMTPRRMVLLERFVGFTLLLFGVLLILKQVFEF